MFIALEPKTVESGFKTRYPGTFWDMKLFLFRWMITTLAVLTAAHIVPGIEYHGMAALFVASLILGLINAVLKPVLMVLSLPLLLLTFGLFTLVINSGLLLMVSHLVKGFDVSGWKSAFWGSLVISVVTLFLKSFQSSPSARISVKVQKPVLRKDKTIDV